MGRPIRAQKRGTALKFRFQSHRAISPSKYTEGNFTVIDIVKDPTKFVPLAVLKSSDGSRLHVRAAEGIAIGDTISVGQTTEIKSGNVMKLADVPEGVPIFNIEGTPGDNGSFVRSSGTFATIMSKGRAIMVSLPSRETKEFLPHCRATIGIAGGGGRKDKHIIKAGKRWHMMKARNKLYPIVSPDNMNAVDHPFGGRTKKGRPKTISRDAPPGAKVGSFGASRTGQRKK